MSTKEYNASFVSTNKFSLSGERVNKAKHSFTSIKNIVGHQYALKLTDAIWKWSGEKT
jgi:hypothetical protein